MFADIINKFNQLANHHQVFFAALAGFSLITLTWGIEKLLEKFLFPRNPIIGYVIAVIGSVLLLFIVQHFVLHVF